MSKWKEIESYLESKSFHESKFNINKKQAQMILDLKKDELKKMRFLAMLDIDKDELKQLAKKDPSIVRAIGRQGGSFRTAMVRKRANEELDVNESNTKKYIEFLKRKGFADIDKMVGQAKRLKLKDRELTDYIDKEINKKKNPFVPDIQKRFMAGEFKKEDAPTNFAGAGSGVDFNPTGLSMKKKKELDARTKEYKIHARKLMAQREKRKLKAQKNLCGSFRKNVKENTDNFAREEFIQEDNVAILRKIVKDKRNMPIKLKDGQMKVDLYTASAFVQTLDTKNMKPDTKKKLEFIINKGNKAQFLRTVDVIFK